MVFLWKLLGSSFYLWCFTGAHLNKGLFFFNTGLFIVYFAGYSMGFSFLWFWDMFLYYLLDHFLPAVSSVLSFWDSYCWMLEFLNRSSNFLTFCCPSLCLFILLPRTFPHLLFSNPPAEIFILALTVFNLPGFFSSLNYPCSFQVRFLCLFVCLLAFHSCRLMVFLK